MRSIFSILTLLLAALLFAQNEQEPAEKPEKPPKDFRPYELKLGVNIVRMGQTFIGAGQDTQELQAALALYSYNFVVDIGTSEIRRGGNFTDADLLDAYSYENKGIYFRAGIDNNFITNKESGNVLSLGLRYARASFEDNLSWFVDNDFGQQNITLSNPSLNARWFELVVNLRGKVTSNLYTGFTLRWQFARSVNKEGTLKTHDIPGFGTTKRQNSTAFDYYLAWRIPFRLSDRDSTP